MARATANCTCSECGAEFTKTATKYNRREANDWVKWAESNYRQCSACWGKEQRQLESEAPLTLVVDCDPYAQMIVLHFEGNTMPRKDEIKALGGYVYDSLPSTGMFGMMSMSRPKIVWWKQVALEAVESELAKAKVLSPVLKNNMSRFDLVAFAEVRESQAEVNAKKAEAMSQIEAPKVPEKLLGGSWNRTVYGRKGAKCIYLDNDKIMLTDAEADEIEEYVVLKAAYKKAVAEIEAKFQLGGRLP